MSGQSSVLVTSHGAYRTIALNRPDKLNAFTRALHGELPAALQAGGGGRQRLSRRPSDGRWAGLLCRAGPDGARLRRRRRA
ncbi:hypothetical protein [Mesorhizobium sp. L-8-3]|uniref:hypothetical protein n=1 Tax=Mesorhizobium sp. L-8-3 TaxID=2744522 RepID=UPI00313C68F7